MIFAIIRTINIFANLLLLLILADCIISWLPVDRNNKIVRLVHSLVEPILTPVRALLAKTPLGGPGMMIDFSPMLACVAIYYIEMLIRTVLIMLIV